MTFKNKKIALDSDDRQIIKDAVQLVLKNFPGQVVNRYGLESMTLQVLHANALLMKSKSKKFFKSRSVISSVIAGMQELVFDGQGDIIVPPSEDPYDRPNQDESKERFGSEKDWTLQSDVELQMSADYDTNHTDVYELSKDTAAYLIAHLAAGMLGAKEVAILKVPTVSNVGSDYNRFLVLKVKE